MEVNRKITIGIILGSIGELFQSHVWPGIADAAQERGARIVVYSGKIPKTPWTADKEIEVIYGMPSASQLDGIVLFSSVLCNFISPDEYEAFYSRYAPLPLVAISREAGNNPCVLVDNKTGMRSIAEHFIRDHGYRRIAFIKGPEGSLEARDRFDAYLEVLGENGIAYDPALAVEADFIPEAGISAAHVLLDERKVTFDALLAANDGALLGALSVFRERGISVPGDIAVGGFDDVDEARSHTPAITTVAQPLHTLGRVACELLLDKIDGRTIEQRTFIPTHLVIRHSCGCTADSVRKVTSGDAEFLLHILPEIKNLPALFRALFSSLAAVLSGELEGKEKQGTFIAAFSGFLDKGNFGEEDFVNLHSMLDLLEESMRIEHEKDQDRISAVLTETRYILSEFLGRTVNWRQFANQLSFLQRLLKSFSTALSMENIYGILESCLDTIGIRECYLSLSAGDTDGNGIIVEPPPESRLVFAFQAGHRVSLPSRGIIFATKNLAPPDFAPGQRQNDYIVFSLVFREENFGFVVFEMSNAARTVFYMEFLHDQLSGALKTARTLEALKKARDYLVHSEKMASLGELTAGIAHELKNPLNFVNNFAEGLGTYIDDIDSAIGKLGHLDRETLNELRTPLEELRLGAASIVSHGKKADRIIRAMLNQARGDTGHDEELRINTLLRESANLAFQSARIQNPAVIVRIEEDFAENIPVLRGNGSQLNRVFINLLSNALYSIRMKSSLIRNFTGVVSLRTCLEHERIMIEIRDNGLGIAERTKPHLFQPFFTTKPNSEGTGLGLKICHDIIVEGLHGTIEADSEEGKYARFLIRLPISGTSREPQGAPQRKEKSRIGPEKS